MKNAHSIVLKILGILLLTAAILKGWQLLTEPLANTDIWSYRPLLIFTIEFELALALWLLSGLFKKAAWLASVAVFSVFSLITLYKALSGADSCGCFGAVKVNPWLTLLAIDLPAVIALLIFRQAPKFILGLRPERPIFDSPGWSEAQPWVKSVQQNQALKGRDKCFLPSTFNFKLSHFAYFATVFLVITISTVALALNKPATVTSSYEVLEPSNWVGKRLPILEYIDIGPQLEKGNWLVLFYHYDCPDCQKAISEYERLGRDNKGNKNFPKIALVEVPPYGLDLRIANSLCIIAKLNNMKNWFMTTPATVLLTEGIVNEANGKNYLLYKEVMHMIVQKVK